MLVKLDHFPNNKICETTTYQDVLLELSNDPDSKLGCFTYLGDVSNLLI